MAMKFIVTMLLAATVIRAQSTPAEPGPYCSLTVHALYFAPFPGCRRPPEAHVRRLPCTYRMG
jgi:hypothetical protein